MGSDLGSVRLDLSQRGVRRVDRGRCAASLSKLRLEMEDFLKEKDVVRDMVCVLEYRIGMDVESSRYLEEGRFWWKRHRKS